MPNQIPKHVHQERFRELAAVESELREKYYRSLIGRRLRVLVETPAENSWLGTSCRYATVELRASKADEGRFVDVLAAEVRGERIVAG